MINLGLTVKRVQLLISSSRCLEYGLMDGSNWRNLT